MTGHCPVLTQVQQALGRPKVPGLGQVLVLWGEQRVKERELGCGERFPGHAEGWSDLGRGRTQPVRVRRDVCQGFPDSTLLKGRVGS